MYVCSLAGGKQAESGSELTAVAISFAYALDSIPTHHLEECFRRAIQQKLDDFPLTAAAVNRAYQELIPELQARAETHSATQEYLLRSGQGSIGLMSFTEWKERHNLPAAWRGTGQSMAISDEPYPPESDLYGTGGLSVFDLREYKCHRCKDSGWLCWPYDKVHNVGPTLMECKCGQAGHPWDGE